MHFDGSIVFLGFIVVWPGVVYCDVMIEDKDVRLRVWLSDGGEVA